VASTGRYPPIVAAKRTAVDKRHLVQPPAVRMDARRIVAVGTLLFFTAFLCLLPFWTWLGRHDHRIWLWTCLAGGLLGIVGYSVMHRHRREGRTL
jgi:drug/metabolite transporter (DMT)-like permease